MKSNVQITGKMCLADMHFVSLKTFFGMRRGQYNNLEEANDFLKEMNELIPFTKDPAISSMIYLARYSILVCGMIIFRQISHNFYSF